MTRPVPRWSSDGATSRGQRGAVTAEAAIVLPLLAIVAVALAWMVAFGIAQVRAHDAAREAARVAARGESDDVARATALKVAPGAATVDIRRQSGAVSVVVVAAVQPPGRVLSFLVGPRASGRAVAAEEGARHASP